MIILFGILLFIIGCCLEASGTDGERYEKNAERRHKELMEQYGRRSETSKKTVRTIVRDEKGRFIAHEETMEYPITKDENKSST